ncbi:MAG: chorismate mutase [Candidatus Acidiferrales bacterium]
MTIGDHRRRVDELDRELVRLLNRRAQMSIQLGQLKKAAGLPARDEAREESILRQVQRCNPGPLDEGALTTIFRAILSESRRITSEMLAETASKVNE